MVRGVGLRRGNIVRHLRNCCKCEGIFRTYRHGSSICFSCMNEMHLKIYFKKFPYDYLDLDEEEKKFYKKIKHKLEE